MLLETLWNVVVSITDYKDKEIVLGQTEILVRPKAVVVVDQTSQCVLQFELVFVVHSYANGQGRVTLTDATASPNLGQQTRLLYVSYSPISSKASSPDLAVELGPRQSHRFVGRLRARLPFCVSKARPSVV